ncbi:MAG TPA: type VI secretion system contractile sheath small subunit [Enterobacter asburiae]|nr:type VI secretion system contractile sheath small subunit [Enterobacter asburiae]HBW95978.1 type VI secretion system contractile sheath small subunit [Enterobacter asburiae]
MADSFQNEVPKARINLKLDLHTGGASKKMELPLKLLVAGDFSNGQESDQISEREKVNITKNNFDSVLSEYSPKLNLTVKNTLSDDGGEENVQLTFQSMKDFTPEQVAAQIPGGELHSDLMTLLYVYLGTRLDVRLQLSVDRSLLPDVTMNIKPDAGAGQLGRTAVMRPLNAANTVTHSKTITINLGRYERVQENIHRRETDEDGDYRW